MSFQPVKTVQVLLPLPFDKPFSYMVKEGVQARVGDFVRVPFGRRTMTGVVWAGNQADDIAEDKLKSIYHVVDVPPMQDALRLFIDWVAFYTVSTKGAVLKMAMSVPAVFEAPKQETLYRLAELLPEKLKQTDARKKVLAAMEDGLAMRMSEIADAAGVTNSVVRGLVKEGALEELSADVAAPCFNHHYHQEIAAPILSDSQEKAAVFLERKVVDAKYSAVLLDGVTGSGKTEVYFAVIENILKEATGQVVILLPEIVLTAQLLQRFEQRFGFRPAVWHSDVSPALKRDTWKAVASGDVRLVVGARSALFLPFQDLKLIIVDEEHEAAFKQEEGVIYHGRDMAIVRALKEQIPIVLASATPSLETLENVKMGKFERVHLDSRFGNAVMPDIDVVDMRHETLERNNWISAPLRQKMAEAVADDKQVMLFLNRRGYAPLTLCRKCGHRFECKDCSSWLVEHRTAHGGFMQCHHCGVTHPLPEECPECQAEKEYLAACGPGVERIAEEVANFLPQANIALMTSDVIANAKEADSMVNDILSGQKNVIIGTQMMAKGHNFPKLTLVGVIDADLGLAGGDLRAAERTYQLLHQVAGRAGRAEDKGAVVIQSYMPENAVIQALKGYKRDEFFKLEAKTRKISQMPPFSRLAALVISGKNELKVIEAAKHIAKQASYGNGYKVLGPAPAPIYQLRGNYRYRLLIKADNAVNIQKIIRKITADIVVQANISLKVDIDPYNFL